MKLPARDSSAAIDLYWLPLGAGGHSVRWNGPGRARVFRYELRRWRDGVISDVSEAVRSPQRLSSQAGEAARLLALVRRVPTPTWGRDELHTGEMWNSNSVTSWLLGPHSPRHDNNRPARRWARARMGRRPRCGESRHWNLEGCYAAGATALCCSMRVARALRGSPVTRIQRSGC